MRRGRRRARASSRTVQRAAVAQVGRIDEEITRDAGGLALFPEDVGTDLRLRTQNNNLVSGVMAGLLVDQTLVIDESQRQAHGAINVLGVKSDGAAGPLGELRLRAGGAAGLNDLNAGQAYINQSAADVLHAAQGDNVAVYSAYWSGQPLRVHVRGIIVSGPLGARPSIILPLLPLQFIARAEHQINRIYIANVGDGLSGVDYSRDIAALAQEALPTGLAVHLVKLNALHLALQARDLFSRILGLYTLFALAIETLLIFLIFSLLATERRSQIATLQVLGAHRGVIVELLLFESTVYTLAATAPGAALGLGIGFLLVAALAHATTPLGITLQLGFEPQSFFAALSASLLFALLVTAVAAWLTSGSTIASALRGTSSAIQGARLLPSVAPARQAPQNTFCGLSRRAWRATSWALHSHWLLPLLLLCVVFLAPWGDDGLATASRALLLGLEAVRDSMSMG